MSEDYSKYLGLIAAVIIAGTVVTAILAVKRRKPRPNPGKMKPVDFGNISVFYDKSGNITIIPYVADLFGEGKATADVIMLPKPYTGIMLGASIRNALVSCRNGKPAGSAMLMDKLGYRGWKAFTEGRANLSVYYRGGTGIVFNTTVRTLEGGYVFNTRGIEHSLPPGAGDEEIGRASLELLKRCRC